MRVTGWSLHAAGIRMLYNESLGSGSGGSSNSSACGVYISWAGLASVLCEACRVNGVCREYL
jgi:hypothetical protein